MTIPDASFSCHPLIDVRWVRRQRGVPDMSLLDCLREQDRVGPNALFDTRFYRATYGSGIPRGMTCLEHFCRQTKEQPFDPNGTFSVRQWHETLGCTYPPPDEWRSALITSLGSEARFALDETERHRAGEVVVKDTVLSRGPVKNQDICIFAHHDPNDIVQPYVLDYLEALREHGMCILFVTNSGDLIPSALESLRSRVWRVICTRNRAYDWGLYSIGVKTLNPFTENALLLTNDSVIGTMNDLGPLFRLARSGQTGITGAVDSWLHCWHLQSFFLYISAETVRSRPWFEFWVNYRPVRDKWFVINSHEFGFSRWMKRHGIEMQAGWEYGRIIAHTSNAASTEWHSDLTSRKIVTNPTVELWNILLERGFPFLKRSVVAQNLAEGNLAQVCNVVSRRSRGSNKTIHA